MLSSKPWTSFKIKSSPYLLHQSVLLLLSCFDPCGLLGLRGILRHFESSSRHTRIRRAIHIICHLYRSSSRGMSNSKRKSRKLEVEVSLWLPSEIGEGDLKMGLAKALKNCQDASTKPASPCSRLEVLLKAAFVPSTSHLLLSPINSAYRIHRRLGPGSSLQEPSKAYYYATRTVIVRTASLRRSSPFLCASPKSRFAVAFHPPNLGASL